MKLRNQLPRYQSRKSLSNAQTTYRNPKKWIKGTIIVKSFISSGNLAAVNDITLVKAGPEARHLSLLFLSFFLKNSESLKQRQEKGEGGRKKKKKKRKTKKKASKQLKKDREKEPRQGTTS